MGSRGEVLLLVKATLAIYLDCLKRAFKGTILNYRLLLLQLLAVVAIAVLIPVVGLFGPVAGGFILGLLLALVLSGYFVMVSAAVNQEKLTWRDIPSGSLELFGPTISVLFFLFIVSMVIGTMFGTAETLWLKLCINMFVAVFLNAAPEIIYLRGGSVGSIFAESFEFIRENFVEWFLPFLVLALPLLIFDSALFFNLNLFFFTTDPLHIVRLVFLSFGDFFVLIGALPLVLISLVALFFVLTFRGCLYNRLSTTTRRKRVFQFSGE